MKREEALKEIKKAMPYMWAETKEAIQTLIPELKESEDERIRKEIIEFIRSQIEDGNSVGWDRWIAYLEKQKEQKPAEWSEEDKEILDDLLDHCNIENATWYNWLKSLRPSWKPSEEQMDALKDAVKLYKETHFERFHTRIESLYNDLKKL